MRFWFVLLLLLFIYRSSYSQNISGPGAVTAKPGSIQANINHLNDVAYDIYLVSPDSARNMAEKALLQSEKIKYAVGIATSYFNIGVIYWSKSYYPIALFYQNMALANAPASNPHLISAIYANIGRIYADLKDYKKSFYNLDKAQAFAGSDGNYLDEAIGEKAYVYLKLGAYDKAIQQSELALKIDQSVNENMGAAILYSRLGTLYLLKKDYTRALAYDDTAYNESIKLHMNRLRAGMYLEYATIDNDQHKYEDAISFSKKSVTLYDSVGVIAGLINGYKELIKSYEAKNDLKQALIFERKYSKVQDSLNTVDKDKSTELIQNYFALNERLNDLALAEKKNQDNKVRIKVQDNIINILVFSLLIVVTALSITYYYYQQKKILSKKLQEQHKALLEQKELIEAQTINLEAVNNLKDKILTVVGHDLRTPIANLHITTALFENDDLTTDEVHRLMKDINPLIKGAELTLSNLLDWAGSHLKGRSVELTHVDIFLSGVEMEQTFKHILEQKNIQFINRAVPGQLVLADENHIKVILRNLISNAMKFTDNNGCVSLSTIVEADKLTIMVQDNGMGMSHK